MDLYKGKKYCKNIEACVETCYQMCIMHHESILTI